MPTKQLTVNIPEPVLISKTWSCNPKCPLLIGDDIPYCCMVYHQTVLRDVYVMSPGPECPQFRGVKQCPKSA